MPFILSARKRNTECAAFSHMSSLFTSLPQWRTKAWWWQIYQRGREEESNSPQHWCHSRLGHDDCQDLSACCWRSLSHAPPLNSSKLTLSSHLISMLEMLSTLTMPVWYLLDRSSNAVIFNFTEEIGNNKVSKSTPTFFLRCCCCGIHWPKHFGESLTLPSCLQSGSIFSLALFCLNTLESGFWYFNLDLPWSLLLLLNLLHSAWGPDHYSCLILIHRFSISTIFCLSFTIQPSHILTNFSNLLSYDSICF